MSPQSVTVVGASLAGLRAAQTLRREGFGGQVTLIGDDPHPAYNRPALSKSYLKDAGTSLNLLALAEAADCTLRTSTRAMSLDIRSRTLTLRTGDGADEEHEFDGLVIATGTTPRTLPWTTLPGVHTLRSATDAAALRTDLLTGRPRVAVVGAGLIGGEVASTCRTLGLEVTLIGQGLPLEVALGGLVGRTVEGVHRDHGVDVRCGVSVAGFEGGDRVSGVRLSTGAVVPADVVIVGIGASPATSWLEGSGIPVADGVLCEPNLAVSGTDRIVAAGDVARLTDVRTGLSHRDEHWESAHRQGEAAARALLGFHDVAPLSATTMYWTEQHDCRLQVIGRPRASHLRLVEGNANTRSFVAADAPGGTVRGAVLLNMPHRLSHFRKLVGRPAGPILHTTSTA